MVWDRHINKIWWCFMILHDFIKNPGDLWFQRLVFFLDKDAGYIIDIQPNPDQTTKHAGHPRMVLTALRLEWSPSYTVSADGVECHLQSYTGQIRTYIIYPGGWAKRKNNTIGDGQFRWRYELFPLHSAGCCMLLVNLPLDHLGRQLDL